jgi:hypothetical protein
MREPLDGAKLAATLTALGQRARGPGRIYLAGGATALMMGIRAMTKDLDIKLQPEPAGVFEAIRDVKEALAVNIELAAPDDFIPAVPGWQERSLFIVRHGQVDFFHYDPLGQALAKISRGHVQDLGDVRAMFALGLFDLASLTDAARAIEPALIRYPALDPATFRAKVEAMVAALFRS